MKNFGSVHSCIILKENGRSRGFGFVTFASHDVAKHVANLRHAIQGKEFGCSLIMPNKDAKSHQIDKKNRKLYIKVKDKIRLTQDEIYEVFHQYGPISDITILKESKERSGFIQFDSKQPVEYLLQHPEVPYKGSIITCEACLSRKEIKKTKQKAQPSTELKEAISRGAKDIPTSNQYKSPKQNKNMADQSNYQNYETYYDQQEEFQDGYENYGANGTTASGYWHDPNEYAGQDYRENNFGQFYPPRMPGGGAKNSKTTKPTYAGEGYDQSPYDYNYGYNEGYDYYEEGEYGQQYEQHHEEDEEHPEAEERDFEPPKIAKRVSGDVQKPKAVEIEVPKKTEALPPINLKITEDKLASPQNNQTPMSSRRPTHGFSIEITCTKDQEAGAIPGDNLSLKVPTENKKGSSVVDATKSPNAESQDGEKGFNLLSIPKAGVKRGSDNLTHKNIPISLLLKTNSTDLIQDSHSSPLFPKIPSQETSPVKPQNEANNEAENKSCKSWDGDPKTSPKREMLASHASRSSNTDHPEEGDQNYLYKKGKERDERRRSDCFHLPSNHSNSPRRKSQFGASPSLQQQLLEPHDPIDMPLQNVMKTNGVYQFVPPFEMDQLKVVGKSVEMDKEEKVVEEDGGRAGGRINKMNNLSLSVPDHNYDPPERPVPLKDNSPLLFQPPPVFSSQSKPDKGKYALSVSLSTS